MTKRSILLCSMLVCTLFACGPRNNNSDGQTLYSGEISIAVDESLRPIMEHELQVYQVNYPEATINPIYCNEVEAVNLLLKDSVRLVIANRRLTEDELASFHSRKFFPESIRLAVGGIALITNKENPDTLISVRQFKDILTGKITEWKQLNESSKLGKLQVVFDNPNSGTIRYAIDSICRGEKLTGELKALKLNDQVIDYVAKTPEAIGVIGVDWVGNSNDSTRLSFNEAVNVMGVTHSINPSAENCVWPYQAYLALRTYPLTHDIFVLINDPRGALPTGLLTFLTSDKGQRIILKSGLVPATQPVNIRPVTVKDE